ncbi:hypothetical protein BDZ94DRAFT_1300949 [Collybia nuda]|uniref:Uncharacterized protein n=1 Tax=Collybia nuda TaxID=64659 RepID=A0A9P5XY07_9AGAR|nr:hypothetical protein BDZ94DRAFT_1300949 [Collybia nuda]
MVSIRSVEPREILYDLEATQLARPPEDPQTFLQESRMGGVFETKVQWKTTLPGYQIETDNVLIKLVEAFTLFVEHSTHNFLFLFVEDYDRLAYLEAEPDFGTNFLCYGLKCHGWIPGETFITGSIFQRRSVRRPGGGHKYAQYRGWEIEQDPFCNTYSLMNAQQECFLGDLGGQREGNVNPNKYFYLHHRKNVHYPKLGKIFDAL